VDSTVVCIRRNRSAAIHASSSRTILSSHILADCHVEATYVGMAYLLFKVLEHPPVEALFGASMCALIAGVAVPKRLYRKLSGEK
jgi:hypothetical protein